MKLFGLLLIFSFISPSVKINVLQHFSKSNSTAVIEISISTSSTKPLFFSFSGTDSVCLPTTPVPLMLDNNTKSARVVVVADDKKYKSKCEINFKYETSDPLYDVERDLFDPSNNVELNLILDSSDRSEILQSCSYTIGDERLLVDIGEEVSTTIVLDHEPIEEVIISTENENENQIFKFNSKNWYIPQNILYKPSSSLLSCSGDKKDKILLKSENCENYHKNTIEVVIKDNCINTYSIIPSTYVLGPSQQAKFKILFPVIPSIQNITIECKDDEKKEIINQIIVKINGKVNEFIFESPKIINSLKTIELKPIINDNNKYECVTSNPTVILKPINDKNVIKSSLLSENIETISNEVIYALTINNNNNNNNNVKVKINSNGFISIPKEVVFKNDENVVEIRAVLNTSSTIHTIQHVLSVLNNNNYVIYPSSAVNIKYIKSNNNTKLEIDCKPGYYIQYYMNKHICINCKVNYYCIGGINQPIRCPIGSSLNNTNGKTVNDCIKDNNNHNNIKIINNNNEKNKKCENGSYYNEIENRCVICPAGYSCISNNNNNNVSIIPCKIGEYSLYNDSNCHSCPKGYYCLTPYSITDKCPLGTYSVGNQNVCKRCDKGSYTDEIGSVKCKTCEDGYYCNSTTSLKCPFGYYSFKNQSFCFKCQLREIMDNNNNNNNNEKDDFDIDDYNEEEEERQCKKYYEENNDEELENEINNNNNNNENDMIIRIFRNRHLRILQSSSSGSNQCPPGTYGSGGVNCEVCPKGQFCSGSSNPQACTPGQYSLGGSLSCSNCPAGYSCQDPSNPKICNVGTYSTGGSTSCTVCEKGYSCTQTGHTKCNNGWYSDQGNYTCYKCPTGYYCAKPEDGPKKCPVGSYSNLEATECTGCPAGYYCIDSSSEPIVCPEGTFSLVNQTQCTTCPAGYYCTSGNKHPCSNGQYSLEGQNSCMNAPAGSYIPAGHHTINSLQPCPLGTYTTAQGSTQCSDCPAGYECKDLKSKTSCSNGYYSLKGDGICSQCPAGFQCTSSAITKCDEGSYSELGSDTCTTCPKGHYCPTIYNSVKLECPTGYYQQNTGEMYCKLCPAGSSCTSSSATPCGIGRYSPLGINECLPCPNGFKCSNERILHQCPRGTYGINGECKECEAGFYCPDGIKRKTCSNGYYAPGGQSRCLPIPPGHQANAQHQSIQQCVNDFQYSIGLKDTCSNCMAGYDCSAKIRGSVYLALCPIGYYCTGTKSPTECPAGKYGDRQGLKAETECKDCPPGFYCDAGTTINDLPYRICPPGKVCGGQTTSTTATSCHNPNINVNDVTGYYVPNYGSSSYQDCFICPPGLYCPVNTINGNTYPIYPTQSCAPGYYCPAGSTSATERACLAGTYRKDRGGRSQSDCDICPPGHYCEAAATEPIPCPVGRYNPSPGAISADACLMCEPGFACPETGLAKPKTKCAKGHYCPAGTVNPTDNKCPAGNYTDTDNAISLAECKPCPERHSCPEACTGYEGTKPMVACSAGHYCPKGTERPNQYPCPAGSYTTRTDTASADECIPCPRGKYCTEGSTTVTGNCSPGYYCPLGSSSSQQYPCLPGTYTTRNDANTQSDCDACTEGHYCPEGTGDPYPCPAGSYRATPEAIGEGPSSNSSEPYCTMCPAGFKCGLMTIHPERCPTGTYSVISSSVCTSCQAGHYCPVTNTSDHVMHTFYRCPAGLYCATGMNRIPSSPDNLCPEGYYCPEATPEPIGCPAGTYNPIKGGKNISDCLITEAGFYTHENSSSYTGECSRGYYCPAGSNTPEAVPCPPGTHNNLTKGTNSSFCVACPSGYYCEKATADPVLCSLGHYCIENSTVPEPCPLGTFGPTKGLKKVTDCSPCTPGKYCDGIGKSQESGNCSQGFVCTGGSYTPDPLGKDFGDICPKGGYCPEGSSDSHSCPPGKYNHVEGGETADDCFDCPPGKYCEGSNSPYPTGDCSPGFYCNGSSPTPTQHETPEGYYTVAGSSEPIPCPIGTYNGNTRKEQCSKCPVGFYCNVTGLTEGKNCPVGFYCPEGTVNPIQCPIGTYGIEENDQNKRCKKCDPGKYCEVNEIIGKDCSAGYFCAGGASVSNPNDGVTGYQCPAGYYCPQGTATPQKCPAGKYSSAVGLADSSECFDCTPGHYCKDQGLTQPTGLCNAGYYCPGGSNNEKHIPCDMGYYCKEGSSIQMKCPPGEFGTSISQVKCNKCLAGKYCTGGTNNNNCPEGSYCPEGTGISAIPCPKGTYRTDQSGKSESECSLCDEGKYCSTAGLTVATVECDAGYLCLKGSFNPYGYTKTKQTPSYCPIGHYCPKGTTTATLGIYKCKKGTYSNELGLRIEEECHKCDAGYYCDEEGLTKKGDICPEGYYCPEGTSEVTNKCNIGYYCPEGTEYDKQYPCPAGTYADERNSTSCKTCPAGYYCPEGSSSYTSNICPPGYYCPEGTKYAKQYPCLPGTFSNQNSLTHSDNCTKCTENHYCAGYGLTVESGTCNRGFYCKLGAESPTPVDGITGLKCNAIDDCPGDSSPSLCPGGKYCKIVGNMKEIKDCLEGYYCKEGSDKKNPNGEKNSKGEEMGNICPKGHYCLEGSTEPTVCPRGHYFPGEGNSIENCVECPGGYNCYNEGIYELNETFICPEGFFCPPGTGIVSIETDSSYYCPAGSFCPKGSAFALPCESGTYSTSIRQSSCEPCEEGYYCPRNATTPIPCPAGYFCESSNTENYIHSPCPIGYYGDQNQVADRSLCQICDLGYYCPVPGLSKSNMTTLYKCPAGYFCKLGVTSSHPTDNIPSSEYNSRTYKGGTICPIGYFCPEGSYKPEPCPRNTYSNSTGNTKPDDCYNCPPGYTCAGGDALPEICEEGKYCMNSISFPCEVKSYCPAGSFKSIPCESGTYSSNTGSKECLTCPAGSYCYEGNNENCQSGFVCPPGTRYQTEHPCNRGYYNSDQSRTDINDCKLCQEGYYCPLSGMYSGTDYECKEGYYCRQGSTSGIPNNILESQFEDGSYSSMIGGGICPKGHYCTSNTYEPVKCPSGYYSSSNYNSEEDDCLKCPPGYYCDSLHYSSFEKCPKGYYCPEGTDTPLMCSPGHYCPDEYLSDPIPCPAGTYNDQNGEITECYKCPEGFFCPEGTSSYQSNRCPSGFYCLEGTKSPNQYPCPQGTYSISSGLISDEYCTSCTAGYYCPIPGMSFSPTNAFKCKGGYYCSGNNISPTPADSICTPGHYCPSGSSEEINCPAGTYNPSYGIDDVSKCLACPPGYICTSEGLTIYSELCPEGYYCSGGTKQTDMSNRCSVGHYCPEGSKIELKCLPGTYQSVEGSSSCMNCSAGYYCIEGTSQLTSSNKCPAGYYCPEGTEYYIQYPCDEGTYNVLTGSESINDCLPCPPGRYCPNKAISEIDGLLECAEGYYCMNKAVISQPNDSVTGVICPPGYYCEKGTEVPIPCPSGTYLPYPGGINEDGCIDCPEGYMCSSDGMTGNLTLCPEGYYCPTGTSGFDGENPPKSCSPGYYCKEGSKNQIKCESGTYQPNVEQSSCIECDAGYYCPEGSTNPELCPVGFYCPSGTGTSSGMVHPCPMGTYSSNAGLTSIDNCTKCDTGSYCQGISLSSVSGSCNEGYFCVNGAYLPSPTDNTTGYICPSGHYCPVGTVEVYMCPSGRFSPATGNTEENDCLICSDGKLCNSDGLSLPEDNCPAGSYCKSGNSEVCDKGYYCPGKTGYQIPCPYGSYSSESGAVSCKVCTEGTYCEKASYEKLSCPSGFYCPSNTSIYEYYPCPAGSYSEAFGLVYESECLTCPAGQYCMGQSNTLPSGSCDEGFYCSSGSKFINPLLIDGLNSGNGNDVKNDLCPRGYYCSEGIDIPTPCPVGTYSNSLGNKQENDCNLCDEGYICNTTALVKPIYKCPLGYYCPEGTSYEGEPCPIGYYCDQTSKVPIPCPDGYYTKDIGQSTCEICPEGYFCDVLTIQTSGSPQDCLPGYYCKKGTSRRTLYPCPPGTYNPNPNVVDINGCLPCTRGSYCEGFGLSEVTGECLAGYYCIGKVSIASPTDNIVYSDSLTEGGSICPKGYYCPQNSGSPQPCPPGTYSQSLGLESESECLPCPAGYECQNEAMTNPYIKPCEEGYYCDGGISIVQNYPDKLCPIGNMCPTGSKVPTPCGLGKYQNQQGQKECITCEAGFYCGYGYSEQVKCPYGYYCPRGTSNPQQNPCPIGTFDVIGGLKKQTDCQKCPTGFYCSETGLQSTSGQCDEGFYCQEGAKVPDPSDSLCPAGYYCKKGTTNPIPCPVGTFSNNTGNRKEEDCVKCPPGYLCDTNDRTSILNECDEGYYCSGNGNEKMPCPTGSYCPKGSVNPLPCPQGTYMSHELSFECEACPAGYYCEGGTDFPINCPIGYYCPENTTYANEYPCPVGTYNNIQGLESKDQCQKCDTGHYCNEVGLVLPSGECDAGYYCKEGSNSSRPIDGVTGWLCNPGFYCPTGTTVEIPCPQGTYSQSYGNEAESNCVSCLAGYICDQLNQTKPIQKCVAGYYCSGGDKSITTANPCPTGHYCPEGSLSPIPCDTGTYQNSLRGIQCDVCEEGYYCTMKTTSPSQCPPGYYCPEGTNSSFHYPCPLGTYSTEFNLKKADECTLCSEGYYCGSVGLTNPTAQCAAGYYCERNSSLPNQHECDAGYICNAGSTIANPDDQIQGEKCPELFYCPKGTHTALSCPAGKYNPNEGQSECIDCLEGYICPSENDNLVICPPNHYCPGGDITGILCPPGTYSYSTGLKNASECLKCPAGKYCIDGTISGDCASGYYCESGSGLPLPEFNYSDTAYPCPPGHYCPTGTERPIECPEGTVRFDSYGKSEQDCEECPGGYICPPGNSVPIPCYLGSYCPSNGIILPCPPYTYNNKRAQQYKSSCLPCPAGSYCIFENTSDPYVSYNQCPEGYFCLEREQNPNVCPDSTYRDRTQGSELNSCNDCVGGYYCPRNTSNYEMYECEGGTYCPVGTFIAFKCPEGFYCPTRTINPIPCPKGYYCPSESESPIKCEIGNYCPEKSTLPLLCPLGTYGNPNAVDELYSDLHTSCIGCPPGTYSVDTSRLNCSLCEPGYVCLGNTNTQYPKDIEIDHGYFCPKGHYCPIGSYQPKECPPGTYNPYLGQETMESCLACEKGYYNPKYGQEGCFICSSSSTSERNSTSCECIGSLRSYQESDGFCVCPPGFEFYVDGTSHQGDGTEDCQPIVYDRCGLGKVRSDGGECVSASSVCDDYCKNTNGNNRGGGGSYIKGTGVCECYGTKPTDEICDEECRNEVPKLTLDEDGNLKVNDRLIANTNNNNDDEIIYGSCKTTCNITSIRINNNNQYEGVFGLTFNSNIRRELLLSSQNNNNNNNNNSIVNPIICLSPGDAVLFDLTNGYPIYKKDSLLNTVDNFDYGEFRALEELVKANETIKSFIYQFTLNGIYVFINSNDPTKDIIIQVKNHTKCESNINSRKSSYFSKESIALQDSDLLLKPLWEFLIPLICFLFVVLFVMIAVMYFYRRLRWGKYAMSLAKKKLKEKIKDEKMKELEGIKEEEEDDNDKPKDGVLLVNHKDKINLNVEPLDSNLLSNSIEDPRELIGNIHYHHVTVTQSSKSQVETIDDMLNTLKNETEKLKALMSSIKLNSTPEDHNKDDLFNRERLILETIENEMKADELNDDRKMNLQNKIIDDISNMINTLAIGSAELSNRIVNECVENEMGEESTNNLDENGNIRVYDSEKINEINSKIADLDNRLSLLRKVAEDTSRRRDGNAPIIAAANTSHLSEEMIDQLNEIEERNKQNDKDLNEFIEKLENIHKNILELKSELNKLENEYQQDVLDNPLMVEDLKKKYKEKINLVLGKLNTEYNKLQDIIGSHKNEQDVNIQQKKNENDVLNEMIKDEKERLDQNEEELKRIPEKKNKKSSVMMTFFGRHLEPNELPENLNELHEKENKLLEEEIKKKEEEDLSNLNNQMLEEQNKIFNDDNEIKEAKKKEIEMDENLTEDEKKKLFADLEKDQQRIYNTLEMERKRQEEDLKNRLLERKLKMKRRQMRKQQEDEIQALLMKKQKEEAELLEEKNKLEQKRLEIEMKHKDEEEILNSVIANSIKTKDEELKADDVVEYKNKLEEEMKKKKEEKERQLEELRKNFEKERIRIEGELKDKLQIERMKKMADMRLKQKEELEKYKEEHNIKNDEEVSKDFLEDQKEELQKLEEEIKRNQESELHHFNNEKSLELLNKENELEDNYNNELEVLHKNLDMDYERITSHLELEKSRQNDIIKEKLERRRKMQEKRLAQKQEEERKRQEMDHENQIKQLKNRLENEGGDWWWEESLTRNIKEEMNDLSLEEQEIIAKKKEEAEKQYKEEIQKQEEEELKKIEEENERIKQEELRKQEELIEAKKEAAKKELREKFQRMESDPNYTQEQLEALRKQHEEQIQSCTEALDNEKERQKQLLEEKLKAKKAKRQLAMKKKLEMEMEKKRDEINNQFDEMSRPKMLERERKAIMDMIEKGEIPANKIGEAITAILQKRHDEELNVLLTRQYKERALIIKSTLEEFFEEKNKKRLDKINEMKKEGLTSLQQEKELEKFDNEYIEKQKEVENNAIYEIRLKHENELNDLNKRQLKEKSETYQQLIPPETLESFMKENERDFKQYQMELQMEKEKRIKEIQAKNKKNQEELERKAKEEMERLEKEQQMKLEEEIRKNKEQMELRREELLNKQKEIQQLRLAELGNLNDEEKGKIIKQFEQDRKNMDEYLLNEHDRQSELMLKKLNERKLKRQQKRDREMHEAILEQKRKEAEEIEIIRKKAEEEAERQRQLSEMAAEEERKRKEEEERLRKEEEERKAAEEAEIAKELAEAAAEAEAEKERKRKEAEEEDKRLELQAQLLENPLNIVVPGMYSDSSVPDEIFERIEKIERIISDIKSYSNNNDYMSNNNNNGSNMNNNNNNFTGLDEIDEIIPEGVLQWVKINDLNEKEYLNWDYLHDFLVYINFDRLNIIPAESLPENNYVNNCYRNSFYFDLSNIENPILYIRRQKFQNFGHLMMLVIHCISHIHSNMMDLSNDNNIEFMESYYIYLRYYIQYIFRLKSELDMKENISMNKDDKYSIPLLKVDDSNTLVDNNNNNNIKAKDKRKSIKSDDSNENDELSDDDDDEEEEEDDDDESSESDFEDVGDEIENRLEKYEVFNKALELYNQTKCSRKVEDSNEVDKEKGDNNNEKEKEKDKDIDRIKEEKIENDRMEIKISLENTIKRLKTRIENEENIKNKDLESLKQLKNDLEDLNHRKKVEGETKSLLKMIDNCCEDVQNLMERVNNREKLIKKLKKDMKVYENEKIKYEKNKK